jgi:acyl-coenzyme A thioesterase PaaI-like protein
MNRNYFYTITTNGSLLHDGTELTDEMFLRQFFSRLQPNTTENFTDEYPFISPCGVEQNFVAPEDTPIVFQQWNRSADGTSKLHFAGGNSIVFSPWNLRFSDDGILYHTSPIGDFGRLHARVLTELSPFVEPWGSIYAFMDRKSNNTDIIPILPLHSHQFSVIRPKPHNHCFGCGEEHPFGLRLPFLHDKETTYVHTWFTPDERLQGMKNYLHGGFISLLLDEVMGKTLFANKSGGALTANLTVNFRKPIPTGKKIQLRGEIQEVETRKRFVYGEILNDEGQKLADGTALFIVPSNFKRP